MSSQIALVPQPRSFPLLGNLLQVDPNGIIQSFMKLAREYGPLFRITLPGAGNALLISGASLVDELCDLQRFDKHVSPALQNLRPLGADGLFTAHTVEPNWGKAHRILTPAFNSPSMRSYFEPMLELALQLVDKWNRLRPDQEIDVTDDMTRLTLDTIALCGFGARFDSFRRPDIHPFVKSMTGALAEAMNRVRRLKLQTNLMWRTKRQFQADISVMNDIVDKVIAERRSGGNFSDKKDLLSLMLAGSDKVTNEKLDDLNIRYQIITFLIAGHETTSGLLSFTFYFLLKHPEILQKAREEADRVLNPRPEGIPQFEDLAQFTYLTAVLKEALRLWPTAPIWAVTPLQDTQLAGKYDVRKGDNLMVLIPMLHRDAEVWGPDAESFNPDNFSSEAMKSRPVNAYKPFGNGKRGCIGRHFAMQEAVLLLAILLNRFEITDANNYQLKIKETLTLKPENFKVRISKRLRPT